MYTLSRKSEDLIDFSMRCKERMSFIQENMSLKHKICLLSTKYRLFNDNNILFK